MVKINYIIFVVIFFFLHGCKEEIQLYSSDSFLKEGYNMVFIGPLHLEYNLKKSSLESQLNSRRNTTMVIYITKSELDRLTTLISMNGFLKPKGEVRVIGKNIIMPPNDDKILIYRYGKLISTFYVNRNYEPRSSRCSVGHLEVLIKRILIRSGATVV